MKPKTRLLTALLTTSCAALIATTATAKDYAIHAGRLLLDGSDQVRTNVTILVKGKRIVAIEPGFSTPAGIEVIDLSRSTVLPGLIDTHQHLNANRPGINTRLKVQSQRPDNPTDGERLLRVSRNYYLYLLQGFTSIRVVGADDGLDIILKRSINSGVVPGPRLWVSGPALGSTGSHADHRILRDFVGDDAHEKPNSIADGADAVRAAVRRNKKMGADWIKIMPGGGGSSIGDDPNAQLMTDDEVRAAVETAHTNGMKVAAHAQGLRPINRAVELGIDSLEHGYNQDASTFKLYKEHGVWMVPTLTRLAGAGIMVRNHPELFDPQQVPKILALDAVGARNFAAAHKAGVKIAYGTDLTYGTPLASDFPLMVAGGMKPIEAIRSATTSAAEMLSSPDVGEISAGKLADIIAVDNDPLTDINSLFDVKFVMKEGVVYKRDGAPTSYITPRDLPAKEY